ncbi:murein transglycosylase A [Silvanigrella aquatica]|uniref:peptidoglycan lytic exotransglycosylase n=1 Tax=Silvanigrella aquatica TaxID=1915309 RepID=A0A1L4CXK5_9BACT|nr:MltA domain-containing protein [Silvanigrella aquatica]APJ02677.1 hypothetical protein AXG55_01520 [Silvanigrella aquatica]
MNKISWLYIIIMTPVFMVSCNTSEKIKTSQNYLFEKASWQEVSINEKMEKKEFFKKALQLNLNWLNRKKENSIFKLKDISFTTKDYICSSSLLINELDQSSNIKFAIKKYFDLYKIKIDNDKKVLYTGYYIPYAEASTVKTSQYNIPVYKTPHDIVTVNLEDFNPDLKGKFIRGRVDKNKLVPYWSREDIADKKKLSNKELEIAWVKNKSDLFFIEIQGSGLLIYPDGNKKFIHYSGQNGREYKAIGSLLLKEGSLTKENVSMQAIRDWLEKNPQEEQRVLNFNKSFVFFNLEDDGPYGNINVKLTAERSIAADQRVLPAGTLTLLNFEMPDVSKINRDSVIKNEIQNTPFSQFSFVQDTGGAIKGPGRIDVFWGEGTRAGDIAGITKQEGNLYILAPKFSCAYLNLQNNIVIK